MNTFLYKIYTFIKEHLFLVAFLVLFVFLVSGYIAGFRPGPNLTFVRVGTLVVEGLPRGATVYVDGARRGASMGVDMRLPLVPGNHNVIIDTGVEFHPWNDLVSIQARTDTISKPLLVSKETKMKTLGDSDFASAKTLLRNYHLPTEASPLLLAEGCAEVRVSENRIIAVGTTTDGCTPPTYLCTGDACIPTILYSAISPIRSILPYPGREDVLVISYGTMVAVLELNPLEPQYAAPVYTGVSPIVLPWTADTLVVIDNGHAYQISL